MLGRSEIHTHEVTFFIYLAHSFAGALGNGYSTTLLGTSACSRWFLHVHTKINESVPKSPAKRENGFA